MPTRPRARGVRFHDFKWFDERTKVSVVVKRQEVQSLFGALAECNGVPVASLLENAEITAGECLTCFQMDQLPQQWSWQVDSAGYLLVKLKQSKVPRGHSFTGDGDDDSDYEPPEDHKKRPSAAASKGSTPQREKRPRMAREGAGEAKIPSPGSPLDAMGHTQPVQIRLHRLAYLATCDDPEVATGLQVRHICGHKRCAVVSHFRIGDAAENEADEAEHESRPGCSREDFGPPQP